MTLQWCELGRLDYETGKGQIQARCLRWGHYLGDTALIGSSEATLQSR